MADKLKQAATVFEVAALKLAALKLAVSKSAVLEVEASESMDMELWC